MDPNEIRLRSLQRILQDDSAVIDSEAPELSKFLNTRRLNYLYITATEVKIIAHKVFEEELENSKVENEIIITRDPETELRKLMKGRIYATSTTMKDALNLRTIFSKILKKPLEEDIEWIRELTKKIDEALNKAVQNITIGMREYELKAEIDYNLEKLGIEQYLYPTVVLFGKRTAYTIGQASDKKLEENEIILLDTAPVYKGYSGSIGRILFTKFDDYWAEKLNILNHVLESATAMLTPGIKMDHIDYYIRNRLKQEGFEYEHYTGHALGGFYGPMIYPESQDTLERNMIFTLEPGIYVHNRGGIRIKNHILAKENGIEILDRFGMGT